MYSKGTVVAEICDHEIHRWPYPGFISSQVRPTSLLLHISCFSEFFAQFPVLWRTIWTVFLDFHLHVTSSMVLYSSSLEHSLNMGFFSCLTPGSLRFYLSNCGIKLNKRFTYVTSRYLMVTTTVLFSISSL